MLLEYIRKKSSRIDRKKELKDFVKSVNEVNLKFNDNDTSIKHFLFHMNFILILARFQKWTIH